MWKLCIQVIRLFFLSLWLPTTLPFQRFSNFSTAAIHKNFKNTLKELYNESLDMVKAHTWARALNCVSLLTLFVKACFLYIITIYLKN
uniref:Putative secreted protein n=1 Tax=Xenopsylla cheopis TaxID=163159 RepID=A0A6M2DYV6_XENCH